MLQLQQPAVQHGLNLQDVSNHLAQILPVVVDKLTPDGQVANASGLASLLAGFTGTGRGEGRMAGLRTRHAARTEVGCWRGRPVRLLAEVPREPPESSNG